VEWHVDPIFSSTITESGLYSCENRGDSPFVDTIRAVDLANGISATATVTVWPCTCRDGSISGTVMDEATGGPIGWVPVQASPNGSGTYTRPDGSYAICGLSTGNYTVRASYGCYVTGYYNDATNLCNATPVSVTAPNETSGIDFALTQGGFISGTVIDETTGLPMERAVDVGVYDYTTTASMRWASTETDGSYKICGLPTGTYAVAVSASKSAYYALWRFYNNARAYSSATPVPVTAPNETSGIDFGLGGGGSISGMVTDQSTGSSAGGFVMAFDETTAQVVASSYTQADGSYTLYDVPTGSHMVGVIPAGMYSVYATEYYNNSPDPSSASPVSVTAPDDTPNIDFTLAQDSGAVSGVVTDQSTGLPIQWIWIIAYDDTTDYWMGFEQPHRDGSYTIPGLPTGSYRVQAGGDAWPPSTSPSVCYLPEYYDNTTDPSAATIVRIAAPHETPNIDFQLSLRDGEGGPTWVELSSFAGHASDRRVRVEWTTESEIDNEGFNIYRSRSRRGTYIRINDALIPAQGSSSEGASYEFIDEDVKNRRTYWYKLEDVDIYGNSTMHGPVKATPRWVYGTRR
jgi:hypothetical protein